MAEVKLWCRKRDPWHLPARALPSRMERRKKKGQQESQRLAPAGWLGRNVTGSSSRLRALLGGCRCVTRGFACVRACVRVRALQGRVYKSRGGRKTEPGRSESCEAPNDLAEQKYLWRRHSWPHSGVSSMRYKHPEQPVNNHTQGPPEPPPPPPPHTIILPTVCQEWTQPGDSCISQKINSDSRET